MKAYLFPAIKLTLLCLLVFAVLYPAMIRAVAWLAPDQGEGRVLMHEGRALYRDVGQSFDQDRYFQARPSAVAYKADGAGGSNKAGSNPEYLQELEARIDTFLVHNPGISRSQVPAELITASGSGLDPHLSPAAARVQIKRIAAIRRIPEARLEALLEAHQKRPLLGPPTLHLLELNIALDQLNPKQ